VSDGVTVSYEDASGEVLREVGKLNQHILQDNQVNGASSIVLELDK